MAREESKRKYDQHYVKTHFFYKITLDEKENRKILEKSAEIGVKPSEFLRSVALDYRGQLKPRPSAINKEVRAELGRIGNNLNQIARVMNNQYNTPEFSSIHGELKLIETHLRALLQELNNDR